MSGPNVLQEDRTEDLLTAAGRPDSGRVSQFWENLWFSPSVLVLPADPGHPAGSKHLVNVLRTKNITRSWFRFWFLDIKTGEEPGFSRAEPGTINQEQANVCSTC